MEIGQKTFVSSSEVVAMTIRALIVGNNQKVLDKLRAIITQEPGFEF